MFVLWANPNQLSNTSIAIPVGHVVHPADERQQWRYPQGKAMFFLLPRSCFVLSTELENWLRLCPVCRLLKDIRYRPHLPYHHFQTLCFLHEELQTECSDHITCSDCQWGVSLLISSANHQVMCTSICSIYDTTYITVLHHFCSPGI